MFTGIIEEIGSVKNIIWGDLSIRLYISCMKVLTDVKKGDSIAVNGICLTVNDFGKNYFACDVMPETMRKTGLSKLKMSDKVNLERALRLSDRLGGHIVSGHIDGTGTIKHKIFEGNAVWLTVFADENILRYIINKGSVTLDGVSLTVAYADDVCFKVSIIPVTAFDTALGDKSPGDTVNIECDLIGKYIEKFNSKKIYAAKEKPDITLEFLRENGF
jgi:riboflavin synthase